MVLGAGCLVPRICNLRFVICNSDHSMVVETEQQESAAQKKAPERGITARAVIIGFIAIIPGRPVILSGAKDLLLPEILRPDGIGTQNDNLLGPRRLDPRDKNVPLLPVLRVSRQWSVVGISQLSTLRCGVRSAGARTALDRWHVAAGFTPAPQSLDGWPVAAGLTPPPR